MVAILPKMCSSQSSYRPCKVIESPEFKMLRFSGLESPEKAIDPGKTLKSTGILK